MPTYKYTGSCGSDFKMFTEENTSAFFSLVGLQLTRKNMFSSMVKHLLHLCRVVKADEAFQVIDNVVMMGSNGFHQQISIHGN